MLRWKASLKPTSGGGGGGSFLFTEKFEGSESDNQGTSGYDNTGWTTVVSQASNVANPNYTPALADAASYQLKQQSTPPYTEDSAVNSFTASANIYMYFIWKMPYMSAVFDAKIKIQDASGNQLVGIGPHYDTLQLKDDGTNTATWSSSAPVKDDELHFWIDRIAGTSIELRYSANATRPASAGLTISSPSGSADAAKIFLKTGHSLGLGVYDNLVINTSPIGSNPLAGGGSTFPSTSLVGFYKLGEASGADALDSGGNGRTFSDNGTVAATTGTIGGETVNVRTLDRPAGKYFSRTDDANFDVGDGEDFTISFWAKVSSSMGNYDTGGIFSKRHNVTASDAGYQICLKKANSTTYVRYNAVCDGTTTLGDSNTDTGIATDAWGHYMMVFTADATLITYVNNAQYSSVDVSSVTGSLANAKDNYIGQLAYNNNGSIIADVTHLGFWKKALDATERTALYNSGKVLAPAAAAPLQTRTVTFTSISEFTIDSYSGQEIWNSKLNQANVGNGLRLWNGSVAGSSGATESSGKWVFSSAGNCTTWWESYYIRVKQDPGTGTYSDWINWTDAGGDIYTSCQPEYNNIGSDVSNYSGPGSWTTHASGFKYQVEIYSASNRP